jgi:DMSO/TMAO reductase YedYZ molybdopterin-dependent catalytic subunit
VALREPIGESIRTSSLAAVAGLIPHYILFYAVNIPLLTDQISEWIMARMPSRYTVSILEHMGAWAKPSAQTGALATLGFVLFLARFGGTFVRGRRATAAVTVVFGMAAAFALSWSCGYASVLGSVAFWAPALGIIALEKRGDEKRSRVEVAGRRQVLVQMARAFPLLMGGGVVAIAAESFLRDRWLAKRAAQPSYLFPFETPADRLTFGDGLVRKAVTPVREFYGMSKDSVDPVVDTRTWRLKVTLEGHVLRTFTYGDLLAMKRELRYVTLRCISNTLESDLMGTAEFQGVHLWQLVDANALPPGIVETALIGVDGHDDSLKLEYAFGPETLLAVAMNGKTLSRTHGFPVRLLAPRYYGCRNVKWISEIRFVREPYHGTWQRLGYTNEPVIHAASHIDHMRRDGLMIEFGGVSFAGSRGIRAVRVRANGGPWEPARLEPALSPYTWTRWVARVQAREGAAIEANAQDGCGAWQTLAPTNPFPNGPDGPTIVIARV